MGTTSPVRSRTDSPEVGDAGRRRELERPVTGTPARALLRRAAAAAVTELVALDRSTPGDDVQHHASLLCDWIELRASDPAARLPPATRAPLLHRVLQRLRTQLLAAAATAEGEMGTPSVFALLQAIEGVQSSLAADEAQQFAARLSGTGGLELLVEVAHDLRSPLASILFLADTLRKAQSGPVTPVQERQLGLIYSAALGLSGVASDVIDLARGGDRLLAPQPIAFSVAQILRSVRDIVQPMAEEKGLALRLETPDADFRVGHPGALNRVLLNLTTNALKFTTEGFVELAARPLSRTRLEFSVRDTGRGIPQGVMDTLFDTFRPRITTGDFVFSSAGLGLAICRKLVDGIGSELRVETGPETGTRFSFEIELPLASRL